MKSLPLLINKNDPIGFVSCSELCLFTTNMIGLVRKEGYEKFSNALFNQVKVEFNAV